MKEFINNPMKTCISIACIAIAIFFIILSYKQLSPANAKMQCQKELDSTRAWDDQRSSWASYEDVYGPNMAKEKYTSCLHRHGE